MQPVDVTLHGKRDFAGAIKLRILGWGWVFPYIIWGSQCNKDQGPYKRKAGGLEKGGSGKKMVEAESERENIPKAVWMRRPPSHHPPTVEKDQSSPGGSSHNSTDPITRAPHSQPNRIPEAHLRMLPQQGLGLHHMHSVHSSWLWSEGRKGEGSRPMT